MCTQKIMATAFAGLFLLILTLSGCGKKDVTLEYRIPKGEESKYKVKATDSETLTLLPENNTNQMKQTMEAEFTRKVDDVDKEGNMTIETTYNNYKLTIERDGKSQEIPTSGMEGKTVTMKMSKRGKVLEMEAADGSASTGSLNQMNQASIIFPEKPVKIGESWQSKDNSTEIPIPGMDAKVVQTSERVFTMESVEKMNGIDCAKIAIKETITQKTEKGKKPATQPDVTMEIKGEGKVSSTLYVAVKTGKIVKHESEMTMTVSRLRVEGSKKQSASSKMQRSMVMELIK